MADLDGEEQDIDELEIPDPPADAPNPSGALELERPEDVLAERHNLNYDVITGDQDVSQVDVDIDEYLDFLKNSFNKSLTRKNPTPSFTILEDLPHGAPIIVVPNDRIDDFPWRTVGRLELGCTGTLVGPRHVLTAGHCVFKNGKYYKLKSLQFRRGQHGTFSSGELFEVSKRYVPHGWTHGEDPEYDYALLVLKTEVDSSVGHMTFGAFGPDVPYKTTKIHINGYPANRGKRMFHTHCLSEPHGKRQLLYKCDTFGGMSGSSVYMIRENNVRVIYAIHSGPWNSEFNRSARITPTTFKQLSDWIDEND